MLLFVWCIWCTHISVSHSATVLQTQCAAISGCFYYDGHAYKGDHMSGSFSYQMSQCAGLPWGMKHGSVTTYHNFEILKRVSSINGFNGPGGVVHSSMRRTDTSSGDLSRGWVFIDSDGTHWKVPHRGTGIGPWLYCARWTTDPNGEGIYSVIDTYYSGYGYCMADTVDGYLTTGTCQFRDPAPVKRIFTRRSQGWKAHDDVVIGSFTYSFRSHCADRCARALPCHSFSYNDQTGDCRLQYNTWGQSYTPGNVAESGYMWYDKPY